MKSAKVILLSINFLLCSMVPVSLMAQDAPLAPDPVIASDGDYLDIVRLTWTDVANETEYQVFRCTTTDTASCGFEIETLPADTNQFDDINADSIGGKHYYRLKSCNGNGCSDFSSADIGFTQQIFSNDYEDDAVEIRNFTVNGKSQDTFEVTDIGPVKLDWSTSNAENCVASSTPTLSDWNTTWDTIDGISTYGPKSLQSIVEAGAYSLGLSCRSAMGLVVVSKIVTVTVRGVPEVPTLVSAEPGNESVVLAFTPNGDGGSEITGYTATCNAIEQDGLSSPITVNGLTNGVEYSCSVIATNVLGDSEPSGAILVTPKTIPKAPTLVSGTAGDENIELAFTPNGDGGSEITGYTATCNAIEQDGLSSPITVNGLTNGVEYSCSVIATNVLGDSGPSGAILVTPKTIPEAPTLVSATAGDENIELAFTPNGDGGSEITGYTATCNAIEQDGLSSPITVNGLTNDVEYTCSVIATNGVGDSVASNVELVTPFSPVQASITKFEVTSDKDPQPVSCGDTNIEFDWEATNADDCYGSWAESVSNPDGLLYGSIDQQTGALFDTESVLFEDLALTKAFTLRCENNNGDTSLNKSLSVEAPCMTTNIESWSEMFTREWPGPVSYTNNVRITKSKARAIKFNTGRVLSQTSTSSPITVSGMQRGAQYSCSVVASDASNDSLPSNLLYFNPVEMVPEAPTLVSATPGDRSAQLTFTARGDLFATTAYQAKCGSTTKTGSSSPITVNNLSNNADYFCSVTARNELGIGERSNQIAVSPQAPSLFVTSVKGGSGVFQASPGAPNTSATVPSAPTLISYELGHLSAELTFSDDDPDATRYTASCRISTAGGVGTIEYGSTRGERLLAISKLPGDFQVAEECKEVQDLDGFLIWKTEGSDYADTACELEPDTDYYWNITFTDGVNIGTSSCEAEGTPCQTYIRVVNPDTVN